MTDRLVAVWPALFSWCFPRGRRRRRCDFRPGIESLEDRSLPSAALRVPLHLTPPRPGAAGALARHHHPREHHHARHRAHPARGSAAPPTGDHAVQDVVHLVQDWLFPF